MKTTLALFALALSSASALADQAPPQWQLPNKGRNCVFRERFEPARITCGSPRYERWTCVTPAKNDFELAESADYLLIGEYGSDVGNACSPTFFVKSVLRAK